MGHHKTAKERSEMAINLCGANAPQTNDACREPEVSGATAALRYSTDDLEGALSVLFGRLEPALSSASPVPSDNQQKALGYSSPLAEAIQGQARRLQGLTASVREITSRLEI